MSASIKLDQTDRKILTILQKHAIKTIRLPKFNYLEDIYANTVHRAMLLRSLQWNNIEKPEAV